MSKANIYKMLMVIGAIILLAGLFMGTTVKSGINEVHNIGLMNDRIITIIIGGVFFIAGAIGTAIIPAQREESSKPIEKHPNEREKDIVAKEQILVEKIEAPAESAYDAEEEHKQIEVEIIAKLKDLEEKLVNKKVKDTSLTTGFMFAIGIPAFILLLLFIFVSTSFFILTPVIYLMIYIKRNTEKPIIRGLIEMNRQHINRSEYKYSVPPNQKRAFYINDEAYKIARKNPYTAELIKTYMQ
jgi:hypothetical protein